MLRMRNQLSREQAEKMFNRKESPDTNLTTKEFMGKTVRRLGRSIANYGKNVAGGAKIVGGAIKKGINKAGTVIADDLFGSKEKNEKQRAAGAAQNAAYSGRGTRRSTSDGSMR